MRSIRLVIPLGMCALLSAWGQEALSDAAADDAALLESGESRNDLHCSVKPDKVTLGWDLKFHAGYQAELPLKQLEGSGNVMWIVLRVAAKGGEGRAVNFRQKIHVPPAAAASGYGGLSGVFDLGEGAYHVGWLMRDSRGRRCSSYWDLEAALAKEDRQILLALPPQTIQPSEAELFQPEPPVHRSPQESPVHVRVLMNYEPQRPSAALLDPQDRIVPVSILRGLSRNPLVGRISLVAFNLQAQRILYQQNACEQIDFPAMGKALDQIKAGTVDVGRLGNKDGDAEFLACLLKSQTSSGDKADGLIFIGRKTLAGSSIRDEDLKEIGELPYPVFYMNYRHAGGAMSGRDSIGRFVKFFQGQEYTLGAPRDLWNAVSETVARIARAKQRKSTLPAAAKP